MCSHTANLATPYPEESQSHLHKHTLKKKEPRNKQTKKHQKIQAKMFQAHKVITWMLKFYAWLWRSCEALESVQCQSEWWGRTPRSTSITPAHLNLRQTPALGPRAVGSGSGGQGPSWAPQRAGQRRSQSTQQRGKTERSNTCQHAKNVGSSVDIMIWPTKAKIEVWQNQEKEKWLVEWVGGGWSWKWRGVGSGCLEKNIFKRGSAINMYYIRNG